MPRVRSRSTSSASPTQRSSERTRTCSGCLSAVASRSSASRSSRWPRAPSPSTRSSGRAGSPSRRSSSRPPPCPRRSGVVDRPARVEMHTGIDAPELDGLPCIDIIESSPARWLGRVQVRAPDRARSPSRRRLRVAADLTSPTRSADFIEQVQELATDDLTEGQRNAACRTSARSSSTCSSPRRCRHTCGRTATRSATSRLCRRALRPMGDRPPQAADGQPSRSARVSSPKGGLVRWRLGSFPPKEIRIRRAEPRSLIPAYRDRAFDLPETLLERDVTSGEPSGDPAAGDTGRGRGGAPLR